MLDDVIRLMIDIDALLIFVVVMATFGPELEFVVLGVDIVGLMMLVGEVVGVVELIYHPHLVGLIVDLIAGGHV